MALKALKLGKESEIIDKVEYDYDTGAMEITFKNTGTTVVGSVPVHVAREFEAPGASSGSLWHRIRSQFSEKD